MDNRNEVLEKVLSEICESCKNCYVEVVSRETNEKMYVMAKHCQDGSGYIDIVLYDKNNNYVDNCKLKYPTDPCLMPFPIDVIGNAECDCED